MVIAIADLAAKEAAAVKATSAARRVSSLLSADAAVATRRARRFVGATYIIERSRVSLSALSRRTARGRVLDARRAGNVAR